MILISNNVNELGIDYPKEAIIRVNTAWVNTCEKLHAELVRLKDCKVYLDYPIGRKKPPLPKISWEELLRFVKYYENIKYFAWSNAQDSTVLSNARNLLPSRVTLVPKIETLIGVLHLKEIVKASQTDVIMIDKEDLATDAGDPEIYQHFLDYARKKSKELNITAIELKGVIFAES